MVSPRGMRCGQLTEEMDCTGDLEDLQHSHQRAEGAVGRGDGEGSRAERASLAGGAGTGKV